MKLKTTFTVYFLLLAIFCVAQQPKHLQLLAEKKNAYNKLMLTFSGTKESIESLIKIGNEGLKLTKPEDHEYRFIFSNAIATANYYQQDFKAAKTYFELSYEEAVKAKLTEKSLKPLGNLIFIYHYIGQQAKADSAAQKLKLIAESTDTLKNKSDIYYNLGIYNQQQKFYYSIALNNFLKSVTLHKPIADTTKILKLKFDYAVKLMMVAEIYLYLKQPNKALEYLNEAKPYFNLSIIVDVSGYGKLIRTYVLLNNKTEALKYYNLLHNATANKAGRWSELVSSSLEMASLFLKNKEIKQAKLYIDRADKQSKLDNSEMLTSSVNLAYGDYYKAINDYTQASKYYKIAEHGSSIYSKEQYADLLKSLTAVEIMLADKNTAASYFNKFVMVSDSLSQRKISLNLAEMEAKFQNETKQQKIRALDRENEAKNIKLGEEKKIRWLLTGGAVLLLVALFFIYLNVRNKQKANLLLDKKNKELDNLNEKLSEANDTKSRLFSIISHDLRSPVSQLFTFLKLQQANPNSLSEEEKNLHQKKLMQSSSSLLATMEDLLLWSKSQLEHFELTIDTITIDQLFDEVMLMMQNQADARQLTLKKGNIEDQYIESDQNLLTIVLRNLLQNAINNAKVHTAITLNKGVNATGKSYIAITNEGEVISADKIEEMLNANSVKSKSSGYGLLIVKELLYKLNATLQIESNPQGTSMIVVFA